VLSMGEVVNRSGGNGFPSPPSPQAGRAWVLQSRTQRETVGIGDADGANEARLNWMTLR
jgi:hypothetical protein